VICVLKTIFWVTKIKKKRKECHDMKKNVSLPPLTKAVDSTLP